MGRSPIGELGMSGSRQPGVTCSYTRPVDVRDGTTCLAPSPLPGAIGHEPILVAASGSLPSVARMSHQEKMAEAIRRAYAAGLISREVMRQLPGIEELVIGIVVVGGVLVGLGLAAGAVASTGVGAVLEAIAAGIVLALAAVGLISSAGQVIAGIGVLISFYTATERATTYRELDVAGRDFATGLAEVGVGTLMMILSVLGARQGLKMGRGAASRWGSASEPAAERPLTPGRTREEPPAPAPKPPRPVPVKPALKTKPMLDAYKGEELPGNSVWGGSRVKYLTDAERAAYKLDFKDGKIYDANGRLFDTSAASSAHSGGGNAIFVMDANGQIYASKTQVVGEFHHSSLAAGQPVAAAGELRVEQGVLKGISDKSGHYRPTSDMTDQALNVLESRGINTSGVTKTIVGAPPSN